MKQKYKVVSRIKAVGGMESRSGSRQWELSSYRVKDIKKNKNKFQEMGTRARG